MRIVYTDPAVDTMIKVYLPDTLASFDSDEVGSDIDTYDRLILQAVNAHFGDTMAMDVLDLDNDKTGEYALVLMRAPLFKLARLIEEKADKWTPS